MKIIILAAGKGERLLPLTRNTPKPLLDLSNGNTLLEEQIDRIQKSSVIDEIVLVIGYLAEQIESKIQTLINKIKIKTIFNPFYDVSNNLISLWLAKHEMDSDFIITNGDNLFAPDVFVDLVKENNEGIFLTVNMKETYDEDDMKVAIENKIITRVSKIIDSNKSHAESPGLVLVSGPRARRIFKENLELLVRDKKNMNAFWLELFNVMHDKGISIHPWWFDGKTKWREVDFHLDIHKVKELLNINNIFP